MLELGDRADFNDPRTDHTYGRSYNYENAWDDPFIFLKALNREADVASDCRTCDARRCRMR